MQKQLRYCRQCTFQNLGNQHPTNRRSPSPLGSNQQLCTWSSQGYWLCGQIERMIPASANNWLKIDIPGRNPPAIHDETQSPKTRNHIHTFFSSPNFPDCDFCSSRRDPGTPLIVTTISSPPAGGWGKVTVTSPQLAPSLARDEETTGAVPFASVPYAIRALTISSCSMLGREHPAPQE